MQRRGVHGAGRTHTGQSLELVPLPLGYADMEPSPGVEPGHLPYGGKVTAVCDGEAAGQRLELR